MKTRKPKQTTKTLIDKLRSGWPEAFTPEELKQIHGAFEDITQENLQLRRLNSAMGLAIYRKRLQVIHEEHDDGSVSFDLQPAPPNDEPDTKPVTVN